MPGADDGAARDPGPRRGRRRRSRGPAGRCDTALAYFHLTKPRVIELLLVTTLPAMILAAGEMPSLGLILAVLVGGALAAGGANTINCWIERDRDQMMRRTAHRPLPHGDVKPEGALVFGLVLEALAFALLWSTVNLLSAALAVSAMLFYVFVYTIWLEAPEPAEHRHRRRRRCGAGARRLGRGHRQRSPRRRGSCSPSCSSGRRRTSGRCRCKYFDDYKAAGIPMLPVAKGIPAAVRQIVVYSFVVVAITFVLPFVTDDVGAVYVVTAAVLGVLFIGQAIRLARDTTPGAGHTVVHLLEHVPRAPLRRRCRRHPPPLRLTPRAVDAPGPSRRARWILAGIAVVVVLVVGVVTWVGRGGLRRRWLVVDGRTAEGPRRRPRVGDVAPDFTLKTLDGKTVSLSDYRGQAGGAELLGVVVQPVPRGVPAASATSWPSTRASSWCSASTTKDIESDARAVRQGARSATWPIVVDSSNEVAKAYGIRRVPQTFFIRPDGTIALRYYAQIPDAKWPAALAKITQPS